MKINFDKINGLIPVIIQHETNLQVLMLGYMNEEAFAKTQKEGKVTFFSRSKNRLWTKGETSGNYLWVKDLSLDCDNDTLLIKAKTNGPTCHTGAISCFSEITSKGFLYQLEQVIDQRIATNCKDSYTNQLYKKGINKIIQKMGEEAVELVIEAKEEDEILFKNEAADLMYHYLILLKAKNIALQEVEEVLMDRSKQRS